VDSRRSEVDSRPARPTDRGEVSLFVSPDSVYAPHVIPASVAAFDTTLSDADWIDHIFKTSTWRGDGKPFAPSFQPSGRIVAYAEDSIRVVVLDRHGQVRLGLPAYARLRLTHPANPHKQLWSVTLDLPPVGMERAEPLPDGRRGFVFYPAILIDDSVVYDRILKGVVLYEKDGELAVGEADPPPEAAGWIRLTDRVAGWSAGPRRP